MRVHYSSPGAGLSAIRSETFQQLFGEYDGCSGYIRSSRMSHSRPSVPAHRWHSSLKRPRALEYQSARLSCHRHPREPQPLLYGSQNIRKKCTCNGCATAVAAGRVLEGRDAPPRTRKPGDSRRESPGSLFGELEGLAPANTLPQPRPGRPRDHCVPGEHGPLHPLLGSSLVRRCDGAGRLRDATPSASRQMVAEFHIPLLGTDLLGALSTLPSSSRRTPCALPAPASPGSGERSGGGSPYGVEQWVRRVRHARTQSRSHRRDRTGTSAREARHTASEHPAAITAP